MDAKKSKSSEFHVDLGDVKLPPEAAERIQAKIQEAVLSELAAYKPNPEGNERLKPWWPKGGPIIVIPPREWWGIIIRWPEGPFSDTVFKDVLSRTNQRFGQ